MKTLNLSQNFYIHEPTKHVCTSEPFTPPRCVKCLSISYWDTDSNICQECFYNDETIIDIKDTYQNEIDELQTDVENLDGKLDELSSLKSKYLCRDTSEADKNLLINQILELIPN